MSNSGFHPGHLMPFLSFPTSDLGGFHLAGTLMVLGDAPVRRSWVLGHASTVGTGSTLVSAAHGPEGETALQSGVNQSLCCRLSTDARQPEPFICEEWKS